MEHTAVAIADSNHRVSTSCKRRGQHLTNNQGALAPIPNTHEVTRHRNQHSTERPHRDVVGPRGESRDERVDLRGLLIRGDRTKAGTRAGSRGATYMDIKAVNPSAH